MRASGDPRRHPERRVRRRHRQPSAPRVATGPRSCARTRSACSRASPRPTRTRARSLHVDEVAMPELAPDEAYVAVMASAINFNTVWTSIFEPLPTFGFLHRLGQGEPVGGPPRPAVPRGRQRRVGRGACGWDRRCATGSPATGSTIHCNYVDDQDPSAHDDSMLATNQRIWGFESNFGGLGRPDAWSRPTSSCRSPPTSRGRRRPATPSPTRPRTG